MLLPKYVSGVTFKIPIPFDFDIDKAAKRLYRVRGVKAVGVTEYDALEILYTPLKELDEDMKT